MYMCTYACTLVCTYTYVCTYTFVCMHMFVFAMYLYMKPCVYIGYYPPTREVSYLLLSPLGSRAVNTIPPEVGG